MCSSDLPRETAFSGYPFGLPGAGELFAWSRLLADQEVLVAINTHGTEPRGAEVTVDGRLQRDSTLTVLYRADWSDAQLAESPDPQGPTAERLPLRRQSDGRLTVRLDLPAAGMVILA